ncbi:MAG: hypothetical protein KC931_07495 [Candidatus Omnitrophica bacterium]|nr:hypothetical protein [Candidatus Omnitrophota bacterium]
MREKLFFAILVTASLGTLLPVARAQDQNVLETLVAYDQAFLSNFTLSAQASYPTTAFDPSQGRCTALVRITGDGAQYAMNCTQLSMDEPHFTPDRVKREYDETGDYVLNYTKDLFVYLGPERWKTRIDQERKTIDSQNRVLEEKSGKPLFDVRPVGHQDPKNRIFRFLLPLGRGYSELLDTVIASEETKEGLLKVFARGALFSPNMGVWELDIDPKAEFLVRSATFSVDEGKHQSVMRRDDPETGSALEGLDLPLWKKGSFLLASNYEISVELSSTSNRADDHLLGQVESAVNTVAADSTLLDFAALSSEGKPLVLRGVETP